MPHCMHAFQLTLAAWMQELCRIKKRPFKGVWICFLPQSAGKWLGSRQIRCNWAVKGATGGIDDKQSSDTKNVVELTSGTSDDGHDKANEDAPENNPQYTTVYVGNLSLEATSVDLHRHFHALGAGVIEDAHIQPDKGFGFVRYSTHAETDQAIHLGNCARREVSLLRPEPVLPHFPLRQRDMSLVYQQLILQHMSSSLLWLGWGVPRL